MTRDFHTGLLLSQLIMSLLIIGLIIWVVWKFIISKAIKSDKENNAYILETNRIRAEAERTKAEALKKIADNIENAPEEWKEQKKDIPKYL